MSGRPAGTAWYVVRTHANAEAKAASNLERQGYSVYLPLILKRRRHARRVEEVPAPLFPRYLFVAMDVSRQRWRSVLSTFGVAQLLMLGERPHPISAGVVEGLRNNEDDQGYFRFARRPPFARGEKVQLVDGVFSAKIGLFEGMSDSDRVAVLLDFMGRKVRVFVNADSLVAA